MHVKLNRRNVATSRDTNSLLDPPPAPPFSLPLPLALSLPSSLDGERNEHINDLGVPATQD